MKKKKIEQDIQRMNILATQIIEVSRELAQPGSENLRYRNSVHKRQRDSKSQLISELMQLIAECRKMNLNQTDRAKFDAAITTLNKKLYEATSLTIL